MTDNSLPTSQSASQDSYVDSYVPPSANQSANKPVNQPTDKPVGQQKKLDSADLAPTSIPVVPSVSTDSSTTAVPSTSSTSSPTSAAPSTDDSLTKLEKALKEYETHYQQQIKQTTSPANQPVSQPVNQSPDQSTNKPVDKPISTDKSDQTVATKPQSIDVTQEDPLIQLEKSLKEYEDRQKQLNKHSRQVVKQVDAVKQKTGETDDPLMELERVLDEYEARYKKQNQNQKVATAPSMNLADTVDDEIPTDQTAKSNNTISQEKYHSILKGKSVGPASLNEPITLADPIPMGKTADTDKTSDVNQVDDINKNKTDNINKIDGVDETTDVNTDNEAEQIENQNVFELLGVMDADAAEKEAFLDELQQALWDDFLDRDLSLLINQKQFEEIKKLREQTDISDEERQNRLIATVEDLIPELEEIMLEKALDLKEAMVQERLAGMKEYFAGRSNELNKIKQAEQHLKARRWQTGSRILNTLIA